MSPQVLVGREPDVQEYGFGVVGQLDAPPEMGRNHGMDDVDAVCRVSGVGKDALLGGLGHGHHPGTPPQGPIQPNLLHQPPLHPACFLQKSVVVDGQDHLAAPQKKGREVDVARDVDDVSLEPPGFPGDLQSVPQTFAVPTRLPPFDFPFRACKMRKQLAKRILDAEVAELPLFAEEPNDFGHDVNLANTHHAIPLISTTLARFRRLRTTCNEEE